GTRAAGVVDQDVDAAVPLGDLLERGGDLVLVGEVGGDEVAGRGGFGGFRGLAGQGHDGRARLVEPPGDAAPAAPGSGGDHDHLAAEGRHVRRYIRAFGGWKRLWARFGFTRSVD